MISEFSSSIYFIVQVSMIGWVVYKSNRIIYVSYGLMTFFSKSRALQLVEMTVDLLLPEFHSFQLDSLLGALLVK